jgi:mono/diheme cytochrome c family protein
MYYIDANLFMNAVMAAVLLTAGLLAVVTVVVVGVRGRARGPGRSYLYLLTALFGCFAAVVLVLGLRGQKSGERPWHFLLDMKYQAKYTSQGESKFFADGRSSRLPPENTIPFDGTDYFADAGFHPGPKPEFLKADSRYFAGVADPTAKETRDGVPVPKDPEWKDGQIAEGYYVARIPEEAVKAAGGWEPLIRRGQYQFNVHCAACHGTSGRGGGGEVAYGIVGAYGLSVPPANLHADDVRAQPDGQLFNSIASGVRNMPSYAHQVKVQDRWAVVAYLRVLQYAHNPPGK